MIDTTEWDAYAAELTARTATAAERLEPVVTKGAVNIKRDARILAAAIGPHARLFPRSITFDVVRERSRVEAQIGPDKGLPQGPLGNLLVYGSSHNGPHDVLGPPLDAEQPRFTDHVGDAAVRLLP